LIKNIKKGNLYLKIQIELYTFRHGLRFVERVRGGSITGGRIVF